MSQQENKMLLVNAAKFEKLTEWLADECDCPSTMGLAEHETKCPSSPMDCHICWNLVLEVEEPSSEKP